jgi:hypothetical protein
MVWLALGNHEMNQLCGEDEGKMRLSAFDDELVTGHEILYITLVCLSWQAHLGRNDSRRPNYHIDVELPRIPQLSEQSMNVISVQLREVRGAVCGNRSETYIRSTVYYYG